MAGPVQIRRSDRLKLLMGTSLVLAPLTECGFQSCLNRVARFRSLTPA
jgi:hypothetical protein